MIVLRRQGDLYFFANCIAWCLGHTEPHKAVEQHVPDDQLHTIQNVGGQFLKREGVYTLASQSDPNKTASFQKWFDSYIQKDS